MELDKFISSSLQSIIKGVKDSQSFALENGAIINPKVGNWDVEKTKTTYFGKEEGAIEVSKIDFDIAVIAENSAEKGGNGSINVFSVKLGGNLTDSSKNESISRIKFNVNMAMPTLEP